MTDPNKTMTLIQLTAYLAQLIKQNPKVADYKVYMSSDSEGNGYATIDPSYSVQFGDPDKIVTLMPFGEGLVDEDIAPIESKQVEAEVKKMMEERNADESTK